MKHTTWPALAWTLLILFVCWLPADRLPIRETTHPSIWELKVPHADKIVHFGVFVIFSTLWLRGRSSPRAYVYIIVSGMLLAVVSELGQGHPWIRRDPDLLDIVADILGVLSGAAFATRLPATWMRRSINDPLHL